MDAAPCAMKYVSLSIYDQTCEESLTCQLLDDGLPNRLGCSRHNTDEAILRKESATAPKRHSRDAQPHQLAIRTIRAEVVIGGAHFGR